MIKCLNVWNLNVIEILLELPEICKASEGKIRRLFLIIFKSP